MAKLYARDGDVLVVSYPEVKVPVAPYTAVAIGNLIYTRKLLAGDDTDEQYTQIYEFLKRRAEADGAEKIRDWSNEFKKAREDAR